MLVVDEKCKFAKRIRDIEAILREKGISITHRCDGLLITVDEETFVIRDEETIVSDFPTDFEPTRIQLQWTGIIGVFTFAPGTPGGAIVGPADVWIEAFGAGGVAVVTADFELLEREA